MTSDSILLIGRDTRTARDVLEVHADRLDRRTDVDDVTVATYGTEPIRDLRDELRTVPGDTVYAVPMCVAHTHDTTDRVPAALSSVPGDVHYCEPPGGNPAVTDVIEQRGTEGLPASEDVSLILVGFGSSSKPHCRRTADYHAERLREDSEYGEVLTCYLLQNPAVECVRYNATGDRAVAVPLFLTRTEATERRIPDALELDRGGVEYADPLGTHPRITDAVHTAVENRRTLADEDAPTTGGEAVASRRPVATDGEGPRR